MGWHVNNRKCFARADPSVPATGVSLLLRVPTQRYDEGPESDGENSHGDDCPGAVGAEITRACRMGAKIRVHPGDSPAHRQFAHLFTRRLLCQLSYTGGRLGAW